MRLKFWFKSQFFPRFSPLQFMGNLNLEQEGQFCLHIYQKCSCVPVFQFLFQFKLRYQKISMVLVYICVVGYYWIHLPFQLGYLLFPIYCYKRRMQGNLVFAPFLIDCCKNIYFASNIAKKGGKTHNKVFEIYDSISEYSN